jgi:Leucine-rich repeat (LRR) protein
MSFKIQTGLLKDFILSQATQEYLRIFGSWDSKVIPAEIGQLENLKSLSIDNTDITAIPAEIGQLSNLEQLSIGICDIRSLPKEIAELKKLRSLHITSALKDYSFLEDLPQLEVLVLIECKLDTFPEAIRKMSKLHTLNLSKNKISTIPDWFSDLSELTVVLLNGNPIKNIEFGPNQKKIQKLDLENCSLDALPESIGFLSALQNLNLYKNNISRLPQSINKLTELESLNIDKNPLPEFPKDLSGFGKLKYFQFDLLWMASYPRPLLQLSSLLKLPKSKKVPERAQMLPALARECRKNNYTEEYSVFLLDLLAERNHIVEAHPNFRKYICEAMNCGLPAIHSTVMEILNGKTVDLNVKNVQIAIVGNTSFNLNELKERLKHLGIDYSPKLNDKVTHAVLGKAPKKLAATLAEGNFVIMSEKSLVDFLNKEDRPYLLEESADAGNSDNLSDLLLSKQAENKGIALEILLKGGLPNELITDLLIIYFNETDQKIRQKARKLLEQYGPASLLPSYSLANSPVRNIFQVRDNNKFFQNFETICEEHGLDRLKILKYHNRENAVNDNYKGCFNGLLLKYLPEQEAAAFLQGLIVDGKLDFSYHELSVIPAKLLSDRLFTERIVDLKMTNCSLRKLPDFVFKCTNLKSLNLYGNSFLTLPTNFNALQEIESLNLDFSNFKEFPQVLIKLEKLSDLKIGFNNIKTLPESMVEMKNLRKLEMVNCLFEKIPEVLFKMNWLSDLNIKKTFNTLLYTKEEMEALKKALGGCRVEV